MSALKLLFWNVHRTRENVCRILKYGKLHCIHIVALSEVPLFITDDSLFGYRKIKHVKETPGIEVYVNAEAISDFHYFRERKRFCLLRICEYNLNLVVAHLNSDRTTTSEDSRETDIYSILNDIERIEKNYDSKQTIIIGDLNMGLFDDRMSHLMGFNAKLFKYQMKRGTRGIHEVDRDLFYNPMLQVYKDHEADDAPRGTYYYEQKYPQWFCYDHILMKQSVSQRFIFSSLKVLGELEDLKLIKNNKPIAAISDHLPVYFELLEKEDIR